MYLYFHCTIENAMKKHSTQLLKATLLIGLFSCIINSNQIQAQSIEDFYEDNKGGRRSVGSQLMFNTSTSGNSSFSYLSLGMHIRVDKAEAFKLRWNYRSRFFDELMGMALQGLISGPDASLNIDDNVAITNGLVGEFNLGLNVFATDQMTAAVGVTLGDYVGDALFEYAMGIGPYLYADYALTNSLAARLEIQHVIIGGASHTTIKPEVFMDNGLFFYYELLTGSNDEYFGTDGNITVDYSRNYLAVGWRF
jgi:hypothetical protein